MLNNILSASNMSYNQPSPIASIHSPWQRQIKTWNHILSAPTLPSAWILTGPTGSNVLEFSLLLSHFLLSLPPRQKSISPQLNLAIGLDLDESDLHINDSNKAIDFAMFVADNLESITILPQHHDFHFLTSRPNAKLANLDESQSNHQQKSDNSSKTKTTGISVDAMREARTFLQNTTAIACNKILLINCVDDMSIGASNALLKILEEPGKDSLIILICHNIHQIMKTIKSRCSVMRFSQVSSEEFCILTGAHSDDDLKMGSDTMLRAVYEATGGDLNLARYVYNEKDLLKVTLEHYNEILSITQIHSSYDKLDDCFGRYLTQLMPIIKTSKIGSEKIIPLISNLLIFALGSMDIGISSTYSPSNDINFANYRDPKPNYEVYFKFEKMMALMEQKNKYHLDETSLYHQMQQVWNINSHF